MANYTVSNIQANHSIVAEFDNTVTLNIGFATGMAGHAKIKYKINNGSWTTITSNTSGITVTSSDSLTLEAIDIDTGYTFRAWQFQAPGAGSNWQGSTNPYTENDFIDAGDFVNISLLMNTVTTYTVTPSAGTGGTISPSTPQTVNAGGSVTFQVTPNSGYRIKSVKLDGSPMSPDS